MCDERKRRYLIIEEINKLQDLSEKIELLRIMNSSEILRNTYIDIENAIMIASPSVPL